MVGAAPRACARLTLGGGHYRMRRPGMQDGNKSIQMRRLELSARGCAGEWKGRAGGAGEWAGTQEVGCADTREVGCAGAEGERRVRMRAVALAPHTHEKKGTSLLVPFRHM